MTQNKAFRSCWNHRYPQEKQLKKKLSTSYTQAKTKSVDNHVENIKVIHRINKKYRITKQAEGKQNQRLQGFDDTENPIKYHVFLCFTFQPCETDTKTPSLSFLHIDL
jgi:hypothetical protein